MKKIFLYVIIIYVKIIVSGISSEIKILYKINDSIITNHDVLEEINYLVSLNKNLSQLNNEQLSSNAERSLIREMIKRDEIKKFYEVDYNEALKSEKIDLIIKNFRENLGFDSSQKFENYLKSKDIDLNNLKKNLLSSNFGINLFLQNTEILLR